jgi:hypothetical protein
VTEICFAQVIDLVGIIEYKSSSHTSNSCCPWGWAACRRSGMLTRATGLEPAASCVTGQRCAEDSKWPKNRHLGHVIAGRSTRYGLLRPHGHPFPIGPPGLFCSGNFGFETIARGRGIKLAPEGAVERRLGFVTDLTSNSDCVNLSGRRPQPSACRAAAFRSR